MPSFSGRSADPAGGPSLRRAFGFLFYNAFEGAGRCPVIKQIIKPQEIPSKLWGTPKPEGTDYRLMRYLLRTVCDDGTLLHNVVTGELVLLDEAEQQLLDRLPAAHEDTMDALIAAHFLVPVGFDECKSVYQMRQVLRRMEDNKTHRLSFFTILPTTACNARCFYCFEAGIKRETMTDSTADMVIDYIKNHAENEKVGIRWFGGEPTVASRIIDRISQGLLDAGIEYSSSMISNAYLFDEEMAERASNLWKLTNIQITLDGTEETYNKTKAYVSVSDNPYLRVIRNIGLLLDKDIFVAVRMNIDRYNEQNLRELITELHNRFGGNKHLSVYAWPVFGDCGYDPAHHDAEDNKWLGEKLLELNSLSREYGYGGDFDEILPSLRSTCCMADNDRTIVIRPGGELVRCLERFEESNVVGNVRDGITDMALYADWRAQVVPEMCHDCVYFPKCVYLKHCGSQDLCYKRDSFRHFDNVVLRKY